MKPLIAATIILFVSAYSYSKSPESYDAVMINHVGQQVLFLVGNRLVNSRGDSVASYQGNALFNDIDRQIAYIENGAIYNMNGRLLGEIDNAYLVSDIGRKIMKIEHGNNLQRLKLGAGYFFYLR